TVGMDTFQATDTTDASLVIGTAAVNFTPGAVSASHSTVVSSPIEVAADGLATSTITVTLKDSLGHAVPGIDVSLAQASGRGTPTISAASGASNASGQVTFTVKSTTTGTDSFQATDTTDSVTIVQTAEVTFGPVSDTHSTLS